MSSPHLTPDLVARCVAEGPACVDPATVAHLRDCAECRSALGDSRLWHALWSADPKRFAGVKSVEGANREFLREIASRDAVSPSRAGNRKLRWPALLGGVAAAAAIALILVWSPFKGSSPDEGPVGDAIRQTALSGLILIPGAETASLNEGPTLRSGFAPLTNEVDSALHSLASAYTDGRSTPALAAQLIGGYLAVGQVGSASDFVRDARNRFPNDQSLLVLEGLVYYCQGNLAQAEDRLRDARERNPRDETATINLASVLVDAGRVNEAATLANEVLSKTDNDVIRARANRIIELTGPSH